MLRGFRKVGLLAQGKVVQANHPITPLQQAVDQVAADKTRRAGDH
jgi:hypothetical protein